VNAYCAITVDRGERPLGVFQLSSAGSGSAFGWSIHAGQAGNLCSIYYLQNVQRFNCGSVPHGGWSRKLLRFGSRILANATS